MAGKTAFRRVAAVAAVGVLGALFQTVGGANAAVARYEVVSVAGGDGTGGRSNAPLLSDDSRFAVFTSAAANLVPGDTNGVRDVFVRDRVGGTTERVSVSSLGEQGNDFSTAESMSADGRYVVFESASSNFVAGDQTNTWDVFLHDRQLRTTVQVNVGANGQPEKPPSLPNWHFPDVSDDGRFVVFHSDDESLVPGDKNGRIDVFLRDVRDQKTILVSTNGQAAAASPLLPFPGSDPGISADDHSACAAISGNGASVAFVSGATNLGSDVPSEHGGIFIKDLATGTTELISRNSAGEAANANSGGQSPGDCPSVDGTGNRVAFTSKATNLAPADTWVPSVYVRDRRTRQTVLASRSIDGTADGWAFLPHLSSDGRAVAFASIASLHPDDTNGTSDGYVTNVDTGGLRPIALTGAGTTPAKGSNAGGISFDGAIVGVDTEAALTRDDTNGMTDAYVLDRTGPGNSDGRKDPRNRL